MADIDTTLAKLEAELIEICPCPQEVRSTNLYWIEMVNYYVNSLLHNCGDHHSSLLLQKLFKYIIYALQ